MSVQLTDKCTTSPYNLRGATVVFDGVPADLPALAIELNKCVPEIWVAEDTHCSHISRFLSLLAVGIEVDDMYPDHQDIQLGQAYIYSRDIELKPATPLAEVVTNTELSGLQTHTVVAVETSHEWRSQAVIDERFNLSILPEDIEDNPIDGRDVAFGDEDVQTTHDLLAAINEGTQVIVDYHRRPLEDYLKEVVSVDGRDSEVVLTSKMRGDEENKISPPLTFDDVDIGLPALTRVNAMSFTSKQNLLKLIIRTTLLICWQGV
ncbi:putative virion structural protein [Salmonella phage SPFM10]|nr:putative virion structural protein [Salmonella phage SPFM10]